MHLAGEATPHYLVGIGFTFSQHPPDALHSGLPPVLGVLLSPLRLGGVHRVFGNGAGDHLAGFVDEERFGSGRAYIETHQVDQFAFLHLFRWVWLEWHGEWNLQAEKAG